LPREPPPLDTGAQIGRYLIIERVGGGAMGDVYGAYDPGLDRKIALKLLKGSDPGNDQTARPRLLREAKAMARVAHPNVIAVHDVGVVDEQIFLAMEFLSGGTLKSWLATGPRGWREVRDVFVAAGRGLAAAHAARLVHRDFKPDNVLLDGQGHPRVVDFGLAREAAAPPGEREEGAHAAAATTSGSHLATLTRRGAIMGTPAYMAPEQIAGDATDERTDQFSFCVALYEALYGVRPFRGESLLQQLDNVTEGRLEPIPDDREVPAWIRRAVLRGLRANPAERWESMAPLIAALEDDPAARQHRRRLVGAAVALALASVVAVTQVVRHRRQALEREIDRRAHDAAQAAEAGRAKAGALRDLRRQAFSAFDTLDRARGEELWREALALAPVADGAFQRAERAYETALVLDPSRAEWEQQLAGVLFEHVLLARDLRRDDQARALSAALERHDPDGRRGALLRQAGTLVLRTDPPTASASLERYEQDAPSGRRVAVPISVPVTPGGTTALPPGSYRLVARAAGYADAVQPFELASGPAPRNRTAPARAGRDPGGLRLRAGRRILVRRRRRKPTHEVPRHRSHPPPPHRRLSHRAPRDHLPRVDRIPRRVAGRGARALRTAPVRTGRLAAPAAGRARMAADAPPNVATVHRKRRGAVHLRGQDAARPSGLAGFSGRRHRARRRRALPPLAARQQARARRTVL
jgi:tetratricopeptide (TPR) repeat protein